MNKYIIILAVLILLVVSVGVITIQEMFGRIDKGIKDNETLRVQDYYNCDIGIKGKCYKVKRYEDFECGPVVRPDSLGGLPVQADKDLHCTLNFSLEEVKK